jgi:hypothetical protein
LPIKIAFKLNLAYLSSQDLFGAGSDGFAGVLPFIMSSVRDRGTLLENAKGRKLR